MVSKFKAGNITVVLNAFNHANIVSIVTLIIEI